MNEATHVVLKNKTLGYIDLVRIESLNLDYNLSDVFSMTTDPKLRYFKHNSTTFIINSRTDKIKRLDKMIGNRWLTYNLSHAERESLLVSFRGIFSKNTLEFFRKHTYVVLLEELLHPSMLFQYLCFFVWIKLEYYEYVAVVGFMTIISKIFSIFSKIRIRKALEKQTRELSKTTVLKGGKWEDIKTSDLVPGDIVKLSNIRTIPADLALIKGDVLVSESILTGESEPIFKKVFIEEDLLKCKIESISRSRSTLFRGTTVIRYGSPPRYSICVVGRTDMSSMQGRIFQSVAYPPKRKGDLEKDMNMFILFSLFSGLIIMVIYQIIVKKTTQVLLIEYTEQLICFPRLFHLL
eukprot:GHVP01065435.1.p1 GENE.GHVP01065435.1~~GHVP01065435.1.p1  ORF type:complete len:351 (+),score=41.10 GHVP01065435.1:373-1425(+)